MNAGLTADWRENPYAAISASPKCHQSVVTKITRAVQDTVETFNYVQQKTGKCLILYDLL
jgi:hypothetical protein